MFPVHCYRYESINQYFHEVTGKWWIYMVTKIGSFGAYWEGNFLNFFELTLLLSLAHFWCPLRPVSLKGHFSQSRFPLSMKSGFGVYQDRGSSWPHVNPACPLPLPPTQYTHSGYPACYFYWNPTHLSVGFLYNIWNSLLCFSEISHRISAGSSSLVLVIPLCKVICPHHIFRQRHLKVSNSLWWKLDSVLIGGNIYPQPVLPLDSQFLFLMNSHPSPRTHNF